MDRPLSTVGFAIALIVIVMLVATLPLSADDASAAHEGPAILSTTATWNLSTIDTARLVGDHVGVAVEPVTGQVWVSYYDEGAGDLWYAKQVGSGGNCGPNSSWQCELVDSNGDVGRENAIAVRHKTTGIGVTIAYYDSTNDALKVASALCNDACEFAVVTIEEAGSLSCCTVGRYPAVAYDLNGVAHVAYRWTDNSGDEKVRHATPTSGTCGGGAWECESAAIGEGVGLYNSIDTDASRRPTIAYYDSNLDAPCTTMKVGITGSCGESNYWYCRTAMTNAHDTGRWVSVQVEDDSTPHLAYFDATDQSLVYARWVGSGGNCGFSSVTMNFEWQCDEIDPDIGPITGNRGVAMAFDGDGRPVIAYRDAASGTYGNILMAARPMTAMPGNTVPNCGPQDLFLTWYCAEADEGGSMLDEAGSVAIATLPDGSQAIAYHELSTAPEPDEGCIKLAVNAESLFADGFESGSTGAWSIASP